MTQTSLVLQTQLLDMASGNQHIRRFALRMDVEHRVNTLLLLLGPVPHVSAMHFFYRCCSLNKFPWRLSEQPGQNGNNTSGVRASDAVDIHCVQLGLHLFFLLRLPDNQVISKILVLLSVMTFGFASFTDNFQRWGWDNLVGDDLWQPPHAWRHHQQEKQD